MPSPAGREGHMGGFPPCPSFRDIKVGQRHPRVPTLWSRMRKGTGSHRHPPVYPAPPAELPRGTADTSDRKLPLCGTETAAGLLAGPERRRRRGAAGCSFTPSPGLHGSTRTPGPAPAAPRARSRPRQARRSGQRQARLRQGKGRRGLLQPRPCRAAPPLPFPVLLAGSAAGEIPAPPPVPSPGGQPGAGREQPPSAPPRTGPAPPPAPAASC